MSMSPTLLSTLTLLSLLFAHNANASWRMDSANLLTARMDPLVSPNAVAAVSTFYFFREATSHGFIAITSMFTM